MSYEQNWRTELYRGMDVYVSALPRNEAHSSWAYAVRIGQPGEDAASASELAAVSGDDAPYGSEHEAVEAALAKGYAMVDQLLN